MRSVYLVCYDVADPARLRRVYQIMLGAGDPLQYSVFRCALAPLEKQRLKEKLWAILNLHEDRVMLVNLGPEGARGDECVEFWGEPRSYPPENKAVVV
jgi:CRISPR-associated protein Cas2